LQAVQQACAEACRLFAPDCTVLPSGNVKPLCALQPKLDGPASKQVLLRRRFESSLLNARKLNKPEAPTVQEHGLLHTRDLSHQAS